MNENAMQAISRNPIADIIPDAGYGMKIPIRSRISQKQSFEQYFLFSIFWTSTS
ncbi:hypothetical protein [Achromobacter deleyi]|uniref:hypothetical protein n=1 Tax=Achromobacter deleyi TaxID=1353891 RepID=UPI001493235E|nr:hypothetical protein [Achromobacter deleyi]QVQ28310.1 hypothetical protein HLG70_07825 [Achromobacter deleyi]